MLGSGLTEQPRGSSRYEEMDRERESESTLVLVPGSVVVSFGSPGTATREDLAKHEPSPQQRHGLNAYSLPPVDLIFTTHANHRTEQPTFALNQDLVTECTRCGFFDPKLGSIFCTLASASGGGQDSYAGTWRQRVRRGLDAARRYG